MKHISLTALMLHFAALPTLADPMTDRAEEALGFAQTSEFTQEQADEVIPFGVETTLPQSGMNETQLQSEGTAMAVDDNTTQGRTFDAIDDGVEDWTPDNVTHGVLNQADSFAEVPRFSRSCERERVTYETACTESPVVVEVESTQRFQCSTFDVGPDCAEPAAASTCEVTQNVCLAEDVDGLCIEDRLTYTCVGTSTVSFDIPQVGATTYVALDVDWVRSCPSNYNATSCFEIPDRNYCSLGAGNFVANGIVVPLDCRRRTVEMECGTDLYTDDCGPYAADASCDVVGETCFTDSIDGQCGNYDVQYQCGGGTTSVDYAACEDIDVCVGETCFTIEQDPNTDAALALAHVEMMNTMSEENTATGEMTPEQQLAYEAGVPLSAGDLAFFAPRLLECRDAILGVYNCCRDSGWGLGWLATCNAEELQLADAKDTERTVYIGRRCSRRALFVCLERSKQYCTYSSEVSKEVSVQAQGQLGVPFTCRGLTLAELGAIDFAQIDLSNAFTDLMDGLQPVTGSDLSSLVSGNISNNAPQIEDYYE